METPEGITSPTEIIRKYNEATKILYDAINQFYESQLETPLKPYAVDIEEVSLSIVTGGFYKAFKKLRGMVFYSNGEYSTCDLPHVKRARMECERFWHYLKCILNGEADQIKKELIYEKQI